MQCPEDQLLIEEKGGEKVKIKKEGCPPFLF